ncbi:unnamed protein product [Euphydryas editha]|uniref:HTH psq-type domain-containing protein n=1 Tax=Euphydryas editha TaxID=104508 RepID=A0AAU9VB57_EUPED|nr:unnamed protein product [Euphydryas editha]
MPRNYSRTTTRQDWDVEQLKKAIISVSEGSFGYLKASQVYGVPKSIKNVQSRMDEGWVQCISCNGWAHEGCTGYESDDLDFFVHLVYGVNVGAKSYIVYGFGQCPG